MYGFGFRAEGLRTQNLGRFLGSRPPGRGYQGLV